MENNNIQEIIKREIDLTKVPSEIMTKAKEVASSIDISNAGAILQYGTGAQTKLSGFAEIVLSEIKAKDSGEVGEIISNLVFKLQDIKIDSLNSNSFLSKLPILNNFVDKVRKFMIKYEKLSVEIDRIIEDLNVAKVKLLSDIEMFDKLYEKNIEYIGDLDVFIVAGHLKLTELQEKILPEIKELAEKQTGALEAQKYRDILQFVNRFEKKLYDLMSSRVVTIQAIPQIRLIQNNDQTLVEHIQSSILNTIPLWKNQFIIAIGLLRQKKAADLQKSVNDATNELLQKNSDMLKTGSIAIAKEVERPIVELETLRKVNIDLISTIESVSQIHREGSARRKQATIELKKIEDELKTKLMNLKAS